MRALIVEEGDIRGAVAATRSLHAAGWTVGVGSPRPGLASASRCCARWHRVPSVAEGHSAFLTSIRQAIERERYEVVFGCGDAEVLALSQSRDSLGAVVPYTRHTGVVRAMDKVELARVAGEVGIRTPDMCTTESAPPWNGPVVVKARIHSPPERDAGPTRLEPRVTHDMAEAARRAQEIRASGGAPFFQKLVAGPLLAHVVVTDRRSTPLAELTQQADRIWPPDAGVSARARVVTPPRELSDRVTRLLRELGWFGLVQLQFVLTSEGEPTLIDFNGRFYGSLSLSLASGCNLAAAWAALATDRPVATLSKPRLGTRYQWLEGDLRWAAAMGGWRSGREAIDCIRYARGAAHSVWRLDDPAPAFRYGLRLAGRGTRKVLHAVGSRQPRGPVTRG